MVDATRFPTTNFPGRLPTVRKTGRLDYDKIQEIALKNSEK
jgi:hypothetical protein